MEWKLIIRGVPVKVFLFERLYKSMQNNTRSRAARAWKPNIDAAQFPRRSFYLILAKFHSWIVSSEADLNPSLPSGHRNRIQICFSSTPQVQNLPNDKLFYIGTHLNVDSWMVSSEVHVTCLSRVVATTESKSVSLGVGSKVADNIFAVRRSSEV